MENSNKIQINSFDDLLDFIHSNELNEEQIQILLESSLGIYYKGPLEKKDLIKKLEIFWWEYQGIKERPLFLDKDFPTISENDQ